MKRISALALLTLASLGACTGATAQESALIAKIPFNFTVGEKGLPAGEYTITSPSAGIVRIVSQDKRVSASVTATHSNHEAPGAGQLEFNRYGNSYFLHRVLGPSTSTMSFDVAAWKSEKRARRLEAQLTPTEQVLVAAR